MYKCPVNGSNGTLAVCISHLRSIEQYEYVMVKAVDADGQEYIMETTLQEDKEKLQFGFNEWQFFRIRVLNEEFESTAMSETVPILPEDELQRKRHCINTPPNGSLCESYLDYNYRLNYNYSLRINFTFVRCANISCTCGGRDINPFLRVKAYNLNGLAHEENIFFDTEDMITINLRSTEIWKKFAVNGLGQKNLSP